MKILIAIVVILSIHPTISWAQVKLKKYQSKGTPFIGNVLYSPDGRKLMTSSDAGAVIWNVADRRKVTEIEDKYYEANDTINDISSKFKNGIFSSGGEYVFFPGEWNENTVLWKTTTPDGILQLKTFKKHNSFYHSTISNSFEYIAFQYIDDSAKMKNALYSVKEERIVRHFSTIDLPGVYVAAICFSPDEKKIVFAFESGDVYIWEIQTNSFIHIATNSWFDPPQKCAFNSNGDKLIVFHGIRNVVYDALNGEKKYEILNFITKHHEENICDEILERADTLITLKDINTDLRTTIRVPEYTILNHPKKAVISHDKRYLVILEQKNTVAVWDLVEKKKKNVISRVKESLYPFIYEFDYDLKINPRGTDAVVSNTDYLCWFDIVTGEVFDEYKGTKGEPVRSRMMKEEGHAFVTTEQKDVGIWNLNTGKRVKENLTVNTYNGDYHYGKNLIAVVKRKSDSIIVYNEEQGSTESIIVAVGESKLDTITDANFNISGTHILVTRNSGNVQVWDVKKGSFLYSLGLENDKIKNIVSTPDDDRYLVNGLNGAAVYDGQSWSRLSVIKGLDYRTTAGITDDSESVIRGPEIFDVSTGERKKLLLDSTGKYGLDGILFSAITGNGMFAFIGSKNALFFWNAKSGKLLRKMLLKNGQVLLDFTLTTDGKNAVAIIQNEVFKHKLLLFSMTTGENVIDGIVASEKICTHNVQDDKVLTTLVEGSIKIWHPDTETSVENSDGIRSENLNTLILTPNPCGGIVNIIVPEKLSEDINYNIYSQFGEKVRSGYINADTGSRQIAIDNLFSGAYFFSAEMFGKKQTILFTVVK